MISKIEDTLSNDITILHCVLETRFFVCGKFQVSYYCYYRLSCRMIDAEANNLLYKCVVAVLIIFSLFIFWALVSNNL